MTRGHSNIKTDEIKLISNTQAMIAIAGGATITSYRDLPSLILKRDEWKTIGDRMDWFTSPPNTNGGCLWIEFHDRGGRIRVEDLSRNGIHDAMFQCTQMLEELEEAKEKLDAIESDEDGDE